MNAERYGRALKRFVLDKNYRIRLLAFLGFYNSMPDEKFLKMLYKANTGEELDLENPVKLNEKLQWLKLHDRKPEYTIMADKYRAKEYIASKVGEEYLIPLLGVWERAEDIDFDALPDSFVLKCNHNSGGVIICRDKSSFDRAAAARRLDEDLKKNYYLEGREWPYKNVKPCIIAEKLLKNDEISDGIWDYKFFCFNGKPKLMYIASDGSSDPRTDFFDMNFEHVNIRMRDGSFDELPTKPEQFDQMKHMAEKLSKGFSHLRVDFYIADGQVYSGEITLYHCSGFINITPKKWDEIIGSWLELPERPQLK